MFLPTWPYTQPSPVNTGVRQKLSLTLNKTDIMPEPLDLTPLHQDLSAVRDELGRHILGQRTVIDETLTGILSRGHVLLVGVPGLAKTRLVDTMGTVLGLETKRVQCTPDLMPGDVIGTEILDEQDGIRRFRFVQGPVFAQMVMVDEINRASPRTQSAFLQAMQEHRVTVAGVDHKLPAPFHVLATQNPIEQDGTYPLPEAQLDRFLLQVNITFPDMAVEREILRATTSGTQTTPKAVLNAARLQEIQTQVERLPIGDAVIAAILTIMHRARPGPNAMKNVADYVEWAPGVRASQALSLATRARALLDGRITPSVDDVIALAPSVLRHRLRPNYRANAEGRNVETLIADLIQSL